MHLIWLLISAVLVGIDRLTKWLVVSNMQPSDTIHLIKIGNKEVLNLYYTLNNGAAFSKLSGKTVFLIIITSAVILWLLYLMIAKKVHRPVYLASISLILGGGIGNLIDRIFNEGLVVDFIDVRIINFPIFNFADICAVCGAGLLLLTVIIDEIRELKQKKLREAAEETESENDNESEELDEEFDDDE
ncbi:MAG: signal peptidase II [Oscillospiraceae bacterium]|nr:signal peptidase II [Oscillospiraceae bacterium]